MNSFSKIIRACVVLYCSQIWAQPVGDDEFTGLERKSNPSGGPATTLMPSTTIDKSKAEFPKLGDYVELDDAMKNEMYGTIDFPNAELKDIIKAISKLANKNFILDRKIENRKVTIISPQPVTKQEAYNAFLSALYMNDLTIVSMGKFLKIIEAKSALQSNIRVFTGDNVPASEEIITLLYKLNYLNVEEIQRYLNDIIARSGRVSFYPNTNTLVMTDTGLNLKKVVSILKQIDVPGHEDQLENIPIRYASAKGIATLVGEILEAQSGSRRTGGSAARNTPQKTRGGGIITKIVPDERTNSLVVLANGRGVIELKSLVAKLDSPDAVGGGNIHIYYCRNAVAEDLSKTITSLISGVSKPDSKAGNNRNVESGLLSPPSTSSSARGGGDDSIRFEGNIKVSFDKPTNALVVVASGSDFAALKTILSKLDIPRRQVYVEATIMEISVGDFQELGAGVNYATPGLMQSAGFLPTTGFPNAAALTAWAGNTAALTGLVAGFGIGKKVDVGGKSISTVSGLINALQTTSQAQILHEPQILTSDNEEATIEVIDEKSVTGDTVTTATGSTVGVKEKTASISLKITPQIGRNGDLVRLKVDQKIDDFRTSEALGKANYDKTKRSANTMVVVRSGDTIVLGGLQKKITSDNRSKFPILGDIPILGWIFKGKSSSLGKSNLILFLTPHIINTYSDLVKITQVKVENRKDYAKGLYEPKDQTGDKVSDLLEKVKIDSKKPAPRGWVFGNKQNGQGAGDDDQKQAADEDLESGQQESSSDNTSVNTRDTSVYIQPAIPEKSATGGEDLTVDSKLRAADAPRQDSFNAGPFEGEGNAGGSNKDEPKVR